MSVDVTRVLRVRAANAVDHTRSLADLDPTWASAVWPCADGWLVLAGVGMYINQALGVGLDDDATGSDLDALVRRSEAHGVIPAVEVVESTRRRTVERVLDRGFELVPDASISCLARELDATPESAAPSRVTSTGTEVSVDDVETADDLVCWQETSATGWGHVEAAARRAADAFAAAAAALDSEHMMIARRTVDDQPIGCASMTLRDGVAMLGGMSTVPTARRRGVQSTLIRRRLERARALGCDLAVSTAARGSASERNLLRHRFQPVTTIERFELVASA